MFSSVPVLRRLGGKRKESSEIRAMTLEQREARVSSELHEAEKCIERGDNRCTSEHLVSARIYESCPLCKRRIGKFEKQVPSLPREQQSKKIQLIREFVVPSAQAHEKITEADRIKPTRRARIRTRLHGFKTMFMKKT